MGDLQASGSSKKAAKDDVSKALAAVLEAKPKTKLEKMAEEKRKAEAERRKREEEMKLQKELREQVS